MACFVSNNSFVDQTAFDGMRRHFERDYSTIYHLGLQGNVRHNPTLSGTAYNVFGIQVGVGITIAVRRKRRSKCKFYYHAVPLEWRRHEKLSWLRECGDLSQVRFRRLKSDEQGSWLTESSSAGFSDFVSIGSKAAKKSNAVQIRDVLFRSYSLGVSTNRDSVTYSFNRQSLMLQIESFAKAYNAELDRLQRNMEKVGDLDSFVDYTRLKWSSTLKGYLSRGQNAEVSAERIRTSIYRPFVQQELYYSHLYVDRPGLHGAFFPTPESARENRLLLVPTVGNRGEWMPFASCLIPNLNLTSIDAFQCFPYFVYDAGGLNRRENITDWALKHFRAHYKNKSIGKWDIFYYVYGVLHHPGYREKFADNLKRELPRIPLAPDFRAFAEAGGRLADLHINYESLEPWPLEWIETPNMPLSYRVEKMRLGKDKKSVVVNDSLTLAGIPPEVFDYRLGNRSAIEWVVDQYRVKEDKRSGIRSDANNADDPEYIVRVVGQVVRVSVETVKIVQSLPERYAPDVKGA
jgi:predicted helicase